MTARAADGEMVTHEDHNHHRLLNLLDQDDTSQGIAVKGRTYEPEFIGVDRGIIGRAPEAITALGNNAPQPMNIDQGNVQFWTFPMVTLQDPLRALDRKLPLNLTATNSSRLEKDLIQLATTPGDTGSSRSVWLTISTCDQPMSKSADNINTPLPLEVYVSRSPSNQRPDKGHSDQVLAVDGGYGNLTLSGVTGDIWIGVRAPTSGGLDGIYNYELVASIDAPYATYFEEENPEAPWDTQMSAWDTDTNSSILATGNITNEFSNSPNFAAWLTMHPPPFSVYVYNPADPRIHGLHKSVCGLKKHAQVQESENSMVKIGGQPKQLFHVKDLNSSSSYNATMTLERQSNNSTVRGGGTVWRATNFTTKSDNNCQIIHSLPFCTDVAYAVPSNPNFTTNITELALTYDNYANDLYQNFSRSLQQIPCETTPSAQYSLARNCQDCDDAYKTWLCAVTIPHCADFSSPSSLTHLMPRNINQNFINGTAVPVESEGLLLSEGNKTTNYYGYSRNSMIDNTIKPGPYKEVLPCKDLCYHLMQNCPAALQFACPEEGRGLNYSYGHYSRGNTEWKCNWPGGKLVSRVEKRGFELGMMGLVLIAALYVS